MRRGLKRLLEILLIIGAAVLVGVFALRSWRSAHVDESELEKTRTPEDRSIIAITYGSDRSTLSFALNDEKEWYWTEYPDYPLDRTKVERLAEDLRAFSPALVTKTADEDAVDNAGLSAPSYELSVKYSDATGFSLQIGTATDEGSYYMRYREEEKAGELYLIDKTLVEDMQDGIYDMYALQSLPQLTERLIDTVTVYHVLTVGEGEEARSEQKSVTYTMKEIEGEYHWFCGVRRVKDDPGVSELMQGLVKLKLCRCVVWQPITESQALCGLRPWQAKVEVHYHDEEDRACELTFAVGYACGETERYVRMVGDSSIYTMSEETLRPFLVIAGLVKE